MGKPAFKDKEESDKGIYRHVVGFETGHPDLPIVYHVNVGHAYPIGVFPLGLTYEIDCTQKKLRFWSQQPYNISRTEFFCPGHFFLDRGISQ